MAQEYYENLVMVCTECHSDLPDAWVNKNAFYRAGSTEVPCVFCGGVARIVNRKSRDQALRQSDQRRGVDITHGKAEKDGQIVGGSDDEDDEY